MKLVLLVVALVFLYFIFAFRFKKVSFIISLIIIAMVLVLNSEHIFTDIQEYLNGGIEKSIKIFKIEEIKPSKDNHEKYHIYDEKENLYFCSVKIDSVFIDDINSKTISNNAIIKYLPSSKEVIDIRYNNQSMVSRRGYADTIGLGIIFVLIFFGGKMLFNAIEKEKFFKHEE
jgi:hypothetical protein